MRFISCSDTPSPRMTTLMRGAKSWVLNWVMSGSSALSGRSTFCTSVRTSCRRRWNSSSGMVLNFSQTKAAPSRELEIMESRSSRSLSSSSRGIVTVFSISSGDTPGSTTRMNAQGKDTLGTCSWGSADRAQIPPPRRAAMIRLTRTDFWTESRGSQFTAAPPPSPPCPG